MKPSTKKQIALTAREVLQVLIDIPRQTRRFGIFRGDVLRYFNRRKVDRQRLQATLHYLQTKGYIYNTLVGKKRYVEVSDAGKAKATAPTFWEKLPRPKQWDKQWRIILFDIPAKWNKTRHKFRYQLLAWGFRPIQESVYAYPFECRKQMNTLIEYFKLIGTVKYLIADVIEGEEDLLKQFIEEGILTKEHF